MPSTPSTGTIPGRIVDRISEITQQLSDPRTNSEAWNWMFQNWKCLHTETGILSLRLYHIYTLWLLFQTRKTDTRGSVSEIKNWYWSVSNKHTWLTMCPSLSPPILMGESRPWRINFWSLLERGLADVLTWRLPQRHEAEVRADS